MTVPGIDSWLAAMFLGLAMYAVLAREPELLMPDVNRHRWNRLRDLGDRWRGRAGIWARDNEDAAAYVRDLRGEEPPPGPEVYTRGSLPFMGRPGMVTVELPFMTGTPREYLPDEQRPPWAVAQETEPEQAEPQLKDLVRADPRAWRSGDNDPPTLVRGMRVLMKDDPDGVVHYVDGLPKYED